MVRRRLTRLRVSHLVPAVFGEDGIFGGAERYAFELARAMALVTPTTLVSFGDAPRKYKTAEGLDVHVLGPARRVRGQDTNRLHLGLLRAVLAADVVHCHQPRTVAAEVAALLARAACRRVVATDHGGGGWCAAGYLRLDRLFHRHLHVSEYSRSISGQSASLRSNVILGGVDTERFSPDAAVVREPLVVFVGRLMPHKGVNDLVDALPDGLALELIGRPYNEAFLADLKRRADGKRVCFRLDCDDSEIIHAYRRAACVVLPSVYRDCYGGETPVPELLGQALLEGMACGTPAICTNVAGMVEVVADGKTGFVVSPNDSVGLRRCLERVRDHPQEVAEMGLAARRRAMDLFTWANVVDRCLRFYTQ